VLDVSYNPQLVLISIAVAFVAAYTALTLSARMLAAPPGENARDRWLMGSAVVMGLGIWTMHFVAMLAFSIGMQVRYRLDLTILSMLLAMVGTAGAFWRASRRRDFRTLFESGLFMGAAIVTMHYTGMAAFSAAVRLDYSPELVAASVLIAVIASTIALWTAFKAFDDLMIRAAAAGFLAVAVSGMHYVGMAALSVMPGEASPPIRFAVDTDSLAVAMVAAVLALAAVSLVAARSDRRLAEAAAREAETLRQAQKMEAIGQLTGGVAHDFGNILQVFSAGLDLLARGKTLEEIAPSMRQAVQRGQSLTEQLLAFARRRGPTVERLDLAKVLAGSRDLLSRALVGGIRFSVRAEPDVWPVEADPNGLELALLNLAVNARDAMPDGGELSITVGNRVLQPSEGLAEKTGLTGEVVEIRIADTGHGMTPDVLAHAFEPFFTTKHSGKGSGLGLPQVFGFVRQSAGGIHIDSEAGRGTVVHLLLPALPHEHPSPGGRDDGRKRRLPSGEASLRIGA
jgi:NO-binding membrane sensor protein with MHYT domain